MALHKKTVIRGRPQGGEPGIQEHGPLEYGFRVRRVAAPRNDKYSVQAIWIVEATNIIYD